MRNVWAFCYFIIILIAAFCFWNCYNRHLVKESNKWFGCRNENGKPVDWFILYKLPRNSNSELPFLKSGVAYIYFTPDDSDKFHRGGISSIFEFSDSSTDWVLSSHSIEDEASLPGQTLQVIYTDKLNEESVYIMYNDEFPNGTVTVEYGHSKGIVFMTAVGGFWIIHSVPKYPSELQYSYPETGHTYGQSMLCISLQPSDSESLGSLLLQNEVFVYNHHIGKSIASKYPVLESVTYKHNMPAESFLIKQMNSIDGESFTCFAKDRKFENDLYSSLVAPYLKSDVLVESWRNGAEKLPSFCNSSYKVMNVKSISIKDINVSFNTTHDHSKWLVTTLSEKPYVCIGDINRMETQYTRGGGTVCLGKIGSWHRFQEIVKDFDKCSTNEI